MSEFDYQTLDDIVHSRVRLAIMAFLATVERAEFGIVRDVVKATDGNLSVHLRKLEDAGYVAVTKRFVARKPQSLYVLTKTGRAALLAHIERLEALLGLKPAAKRKSP
ncbi:MAG: transcriptional regulator [Proteobacteria bacterium]|nr:transcriptional regulator [Pseudomonadota bacterium]